MSAPPRATSLGGGAEGAAVDQATAPAHGMYAGSFVMTIRPIASDSR